MTRSIEKKYAEEFKQPFVIDSIKESGAEEVLGWKHPQHHKEFLRWSKWVRRVLEECIWWELNGGAKNINSHLHLRLLSLYRDIYDKELLHFDHMQGARLPLKQGQEPKQEDWGSWYRKRSVEAEQWYRHWCAHIGAVEPFGPLTTRRTMKFRSMWHLMRSKKGWNTNT